MIQKKESRSFGALVYIVAIVTAAMIFPLIYELAESYSYTSEKTIGESEVSGERNAKNKNYSVIENTIDLSMLKNTEFGALSLVSARVLNSKSLVLFCSVRIELDAGEGGEYAPPSYETRLQIAALKNLRDSEDGGEGYYNAKGDLEIYGRALPARYGLLESVQSGDFVFTDFGDGTFFMSNSKNAFLFDADNMKMAANYPYPPNYNIYQSAMSNNKEMLALAAEEGFFINNLKESNLAINYYDLKELIATTTNDNGVKLTARYPMWSSDDSRIFYKLYADDSIKNAGVTATSPGGNEQLVALDCSDFLFMANDSIFYYFSSSTANTATGPGILFRCGYFSPSEKKMSDIMRSQVYYFDVDISQNGNLLAALSYNGNLVKLSIIDIFTKKLIYSCLYSEIYDFSFSPDEKNLLVYGTADGKKSLKLINIDWESAS